MVNNIFKVIAILAMLALVAACDSGPSEDYSTLSLSLGTGEADPFTYLDADQRQIELWAELVGENVAADSGNGNTGTGGNVGNPIGGAPPVPVADPNVTCGNPLECAMIDAVNDYRRSAGLRALVLDGACVRASQAHAQDMATFNYISHTGRDGSSPVSRALRNGATSYRVSENIAYSLTDVQYTLNLWINSAGHRANLLDPAATHTGVGATTVGSTVYWVQCFMAR